MHNTYASSLKFERETQSLIYTIPDFLQDPFG